VKCAFLNVLHSQSQPGTDHPGDEGGKTQTVRYEAVNAMLLNEFLKEHKKNEVQAQTIAESKSTLVQQQRAIEQLATQMQKVSAQVQLNGRSTIAANP
jgi:uncharacterized coiled-coil protein SlyX